MGKSIISTGPFSSSQTVSHYQRVLFSSPLIFMEYQPGASTSSTALRHAWGQLGGDPPQFRMARPKVGETRLYGGCHELVGLFSQISLMFEYTMLVYNPSEIAGSIVFWSPENNRKSR